MLIIISIVVLIVLVAIVLSVLEQKKEARLAAEQRSEQENELLRQAAKEKMQLAVVANHGSEPAQDEQTDISDSDLDKIKAAYAKFEQDVTAWEAKFQAPDAWPPAEAAAIRTAQLKYRMYFDQAFYKKHGDSVASQEWREWTDAFSELLERHARLIEIDEPEENEDDEEEDEAEHAAATMPSETAEQGAALAEMPSENQTAAESKAEHAAETQESATPTAETAQSDGEPDETAQADGEDEDDGADEATAFAPAADGDIFSATFTAADAPRAEVDEDELKGRERELWEYANRRNLSKRESGDRYERYLGYLYERAGWRVEYYGLTEGVANSNRGIDLICTDGETVHFVQTKYWSDGVAAKTNINNVIDRTVKNMQSVVESRRIQGKIQAVLAAKPKLAAEVAAYAAEQNVLLLDDLSMQPYPLVKCHTGKRGSKKYFLPYLADKTAAKYEEIKQGAWEAYDLVLMNPANGDRYVHTIEEAEALGYKYSSRA